MQGIVTFLYGCLMCVVTIMSNAFNDKKINTINEKQEKVETMLNI